MRDKTDLLRRAAELRDQRRYDEVVRIYVQMLDAFGRDPNIMWGLAQAESALSAIPPDATDSHGHKAIHWIEQAIPLHSSSPDYYYTLGYMLAQVAAPNYPATAQAYRRALEFEPFYVPALIGLARLYGVLEDVVVLQDAISYCERAVR